MPGNTPNYTCRRVVLRNRIHAAKYRPRDAEPHIHPYIAASLRCHIPAVCVMTRRRLWTAVHAIASASLSAGQYRAGGTRHVVQVHSHCRRVSCDKWTGPVPHLRNEHLSPTHIKCSNHICFVSAQRTGYAAACPSPSCCPCPLSPSTCATTKSPPPPPSCHHRYPLLLPPCRLVAPAPPKQTQCTRPQPPPEVGKAAATLNHFSQDPCISPGPVELARIRRSFGGGIKEINAGQEEEGWRPPVAVRGALGGTGQLMVMIRSGRGVRPRWSHKGARW